MANIDITRSYNDAQLLSASDIDNIVEGTKQFINITNLNDDNIQDEGIDASVSLTLSSISTAKLIDSSVVSVKIADSPDGVAAAKINDSAITTAKINDSAVTTAKINDGAVTQAKLAALTSTASPSSGTQTITRSGSISDANYTTINNSLIYATIDNRPVLFTVQGVDNAAKIGDNSSLFSVYVALFRNETIVSARRVIDNSSLSNLCFIEYAAANGTYGYTLRSYSVGTSSAENVEVINVKLSATQL